MRCPKETHLVSAAGGGAEHNLKYAPLVGMRAYSFIQSCACGQCHYCAQNKEKRLSFAMSLAGIHEENVL